MGITLSVPNQTTGITLQGAGTGGSTIGASSLQGSNNASQILQPAAGSAALNTAPSSSNQASQTTTGSGSGSGTGSNIAALLAQISDQANNIVGNGENTFANSANDYQTQANSLLSSLQSGQANVNKEIQTAESNKIQSLRGLMSDVGNGLRSGGVQLASGNALDSSAANALARAYSNYATNQRGSIGQTEQGALSQASQDQNTLNQQQTQGLAQLTSLRNDAATQVGNDVASQLQNLDYQANNGGITGKVDVQGMKQQVVNDGLAKLNAIDQWLQGQLSSTVNPQSTDAAAAAAYQQLQAGASSAGAGGTFDTNTNITPVNAQGAPVAGAFDSLLPLYLRNNNNTQTA